MLNLLDDVLLKQHDEKNKGKLYSTSPSSAGKCLRGATYGRLGFVPRKFPPRILRVFEDGNMHEESVLEHIRLLEKMGHLKIVGEQFEVWVDLGIQDKKMHGFIDVIINIDNIPIPVEIKSASKASFSMAKRQPHFAHVLQLNCYLKATKQKFGWIWYKNKDNAEYFIHEVRFSEAIWDQTVEYFRKVERLIQPIERYVKDGAWITNRSDLLPARPFWRTDFECMFCNYSDICWEGFAESFKEFVSSEDKELEPILKRFYELKQSVKQSEDELVILKEQIRAKLLRAESCAILTDDYEASLKRFGKHMGVVVRKI